MGCNSSKFLYGESDDRTEEPRPWEEGMGNAVEAILTSDGTGGGHGGRDGLGASGGGDHGGLGGSHGLS